MIPIAAQQFMCERAGAKATVACASAYALEIPRWAVAELGSNGPVLGCVMLGSLVIVVLGVKVVTVRYVRMVRGFHVIAGFVMLGGLIVMVRSVPAVFCRVPVVLGGFLVIGHVVSPFFGYRTKNVRCT